MPKFLLLLEELVTQRLKFFLRLYRLKFVLVNSCRPEWLSWSVDRGIQAGFPGAWKAKVRPKPARRTRGGGRPKQAEQIEGSTRKVSEAYDIQTGQPHALIVEADLACRMGLQHLFAVILGRSARVTADGAEVLGALRGGVRPRLVVVGLCSGQDVALAVIGAAKATGACVIALDWRQASDWAVRAFLAGADDVAPAPIRLKEFALRMAARLGPQDSGLAACQLDLTADWETEADIALRAGLTEAEARVVSILIGGGGHIVTRDELSLAIDQRPWDYGDRKFDVHVAKIRKKLCKAFGTRITVSTVRALGYRMTIAGSDLSPQGGQQLG